MSGLYELFPDNAKVLTSLRGLAAALSDGGYLIYTNQPWHPQVEMIARVLINRDQQPWVMRRRTQAEMDQLVQAAGFEKIDMAIDATASSPSPSRGGSRATSNGRSITDCYLDQRFPPGFV